MKGIIKKLLRENLMNEVSDELYDVIQKDYSQYRIVMANREGKDVLSGVRNTKQKITGSKPFGMWYAFGTEWVDWVRSEMPDWERDKAYLLDVNESKILKISTPQELEEFNNRYVRDEFNVNWASVGQKFSGIEINPYQYSYRHKYMWYYGWDVASGCIWDNSAVKGLKEITI